MAASSPQNTAVCLQGVIRMLTFTLKALCIPGRKCEPQWNPSVEYVQGFSGAPYMFPTESECHSDYELIRTLICLPAITPFFNPSSCMKTQANYFPAGKSNILNCNMKTVGFFFYFPLFSFVNLQFFLSVSTSEMMMMMLWQCVSPEELGWLSSIRFTAPPPSFCGFEHHDSGGGIDAAAESVVRWIDKHSGLSSGLLV